MSLRRRYPSKSLAKMVKTRMAWKVMSKSGLFIKWLMKINKEKCSQSKVDLFQTWATKLCGLLINMDQRLTEDIS
jgi:hypothetical protein